MRRRKPASFLAVFVLASIAFIRLNAQTAPAPAASPATPPAASGAPQLQPRPATPPPPVIDNSITTIRVQANEVSLFFTVTDAKGHFITGLHLEDFGLADDGKPPILPIIAFRQQTKLPLRVGIMLDTSSSIRDRFQFELDSATEFLLQTLHLDDRAFVEGFDIQTDIAQPFTNNIDLLSQGIHRLRPGGGTALFDSLYKTCRDQMLPLREQNVVRKAIILVSDGDDNYSRALETDAIKECQRAETIVYTISTDVSPSRDKGEDVLNAIAQATGGAAFFPAKLEDIARYFTDIQEELRSQYLLEYRPADFKNDGSFRTIYLQARDHRYHVRAKTGYFSPRPAQ